MKISKAKELCRKISDLKAVGDTEAAELLKRSHQLVFGKLTKKLQREIAGAQA